MSAYPSRSGEAGQISGRIFCGPLAACRWGAKVSGTFAARGLLARNSHCSGAGSDDSLKPSKGLARGLMDTAKERRAARRFSMMLPLKVRFSEEDDVLERQGETRDVSFRGLYFMIEARVEAGTPIEFVLTLPQQITLAGDVHIRCYARVLRVEPHDGRRGVAARIDRYEFLPASA
jgi:hypothetical protein